MAQRASIRIAAWLPALMGWLLLGGGWACGESVPRPHIVLISIDTLRADHTSAYGYGRDTTPNLRRESARGARVELAYASSSTTGPTQATLFTGLHPISHGLDRNGRPLAQAHETLAELLRAAGWETAAVVSSFVMHGKFGYDQGFDTYLDDFPDDHSKTRTHYWERHWVGGSFDSRADHTTDRALAWLDGREAPDRPFFLFVHYFDPHEPYKPVASFSDRFPKPAADELKLDREIRAYDTEIAYCDHHIGRLLDGIDQRVPPDRTLVIVTSDHGQGLMQHGDPYHSISIYEEDLRVPLLFRWDGQVAAGRVAPGPVGLADLMPTVLDLAGVAFPTAGFEGRSLRGALLDGAVTDPRQPIHFQRQNYSGRERLRGRTPVGSQFGVRVERWKYVVAPDEGTHELYDLSEDPGEQHDRYEDRPEIARELDARIAAWRAGARRLPAEPSAVSPEDRERLQELGYVE